MFTCVLFPIFILYFLYLTNNTLLSIYFLYSKIYARNIKYILSLFRVQIFKNRKQILVINREQIEKKCDNFVIKIKNKKKIKIGNKSQVNAPYSL